jgi:hypothetical protein
MKQNFTQIIATIKNQRGIHVGPTGLIVGMLINLKMK